MPGEEEEEGRRRVGWARSDICAREKGAEDPFPEVENLGRKMMLVK